MAKVPMRSLVLFTLGSSRIEQYYIDGAFREHTTIIKITDDTFWSSQYRYLVTYYIVYQRRHYYYYNSNTIITHHWLVVTIKYYYYYYYWLLQDTTKYYY